MYGLRDSVVKPLIIGYINRLGGFPSSNEAAFANSLVPKFQARKLEDGGHVRESERHANSVDTESECGRERLQNNGGSREREDHRNSVVSEYLHDPTP